MTRVCHTDIFTFLIIAWTELSLITAYFKTIEVPCLSSLDLGFHKPLLPQG